jgi:cell division septum initiation protein DivIVA
MRKQFVTALLGFSKGQVNKYINDLKTEYENDLSKQKDRIMELIEENRRLKNEIQALNEKINSSREQEKYITKVLVIAEQKAQSIIEEGRRKSMEDLSRLKAEKEKWIERIREVRTDLLGFEKKIVELLEKFRDDINYYAAQEISEALLFDESSEQAEQNKEKKVIA